MSYLVILLATVASLISFYITLTRHAVHAVLGLIVVFLLTAIMWFIIQAEYLAIMLILVYVGAVMVLFLFVVMMVQPPSSSMNFESLSLNDLLTFVLCGALAIVFLPELSLRVKPLMPIDENTSSVRELGLSLFTDYLHPFLLAGILLIAAIVAAVGLTFRGPQRRLNQDVDKQIQATKANRLKIIYDKKESST